MLKPPIEKKDSSLSDSSSILQDIRQLVETSRLRVANSVNAELSLLYWKIGNRIRNEILSGQRADYGKQIVAALAHKLTMEYGNGFAEKNLRRMMQFSEVFADENIVVSLIRQLSWTHFLALIPIKDDLQRQYYAELCRVERWSVRTLRKKIDSMLFERTALSKKPDELAEIELKELRENDVISPNLVFRDPYFLDFLGLKDHYLERDLEDAILREMEQFLLELGGGFAFLGRQKRIQIDNDDFYLDLLFYNRYLKRLIVVDLKLGDFKAEYKGQMELYLRWLDKHERQPEEAPPLGIILCAGKKQEIVELLELDQSGIHVAEYMTSLPSKELIQQKLHAAIEQSKLRLENRDNSDE